MVLRDGAFTGDAFAVIGFRIEDRSVPVPGRQPSRINAGQARSDTRANLLIGKEANFASNE